MKWQIPSRLSAAVAVVCTLTTSQTSFAKETSPACVNPGIIVESIVKGRQADKLGVRPGDIMLRWSRGDVAGEIDSPFAVSHVAIEQASRGIVRVYGQRETRPRIWMFESDSWGIQTRPNFVGRCLSIY